MLYDMFKMFTPTFSEITKTTTCNPYLFKSHMIAVVSLDVVTAILYD